MTSIGLAPAITFRINSLGVLPREEHVRLHVIKIGRLASSNLRIEAETVARMHAIIEARAEDDVSIIDLGSMHGTYVNGQKVTKARLKTGDVLRLGNAIVELAIEASTVPVGDPGPLQPPAEAPRLGEDIPRATPGPIPNWADRIDQFPEPRQRALIACQIQTGWHSTGAWEARTYDVRRGAIPEQGWLIDYGGGWVGGGMRSSWKDVLDWVKCLKPRDVELIDVSQEDA